MLLYVSTSHRLFWSVLSTTSQEGTLMNPSGPGRRDREGEGSGRNKAANTSEVLRAVSSTYAAFKERQPLVLSSTTREREKLCSVWLNGKIRT